MTSRRSRRRRRCCRRWRSSRPRQSPTSVRHRGRRHPSACRHRRRREALPHSADLWCRPGHPGLWGPSSPPGRPAPSGPATRAGRRGRRPGPAGRRCSSPRRPRRPGSPARPEPARAAPGARALIRVVVGLMPAARVRSRTSRDLLVGHQRDHGAGVAGARRTAGAVQVGLVLDRRVGVDDQRRRRRRGCRGRRCRWPPAWWPCRSGRPPCCGCGRSGSRLPCSSTVGTPLLLSWRASALAPCLVRVKTTVRPGALVRSTSTGTRCSRWTCSTWWAIVRDRRLRRVGLVGHRVRQEPLDQHVDAVSRVAENSSRWPPRGVCSSSRRTAGRKPRSAMWSASSSTVISTRRGCSGPGRSGPRAGRGRRRRCRRRCAGR